MESCIVVGESHKDFASCTGALTLTAFRHWVREIPSTNLLEVVLGQGLGTAGRAAARALLEHSAHQVRIPSPEEEVAPLSLTHKRDLEHNLITMPRRVAPHSYELTLQVDDSCDRLSDHTTGMHLGGMLLVEGARQATIAALELEYPATDTAQWGMVWSGLNVHFSSYAFPLPIEISVDVQEDTSKRTKTQISTSLKIEVRQSLEVVCRLQFEVTLIERSLLHRIEAKRARQLVANRVRVTRTVAPPASACAPAPAPAEGAE